MNGGDQVMQFWISADVESHAAARRRNKRRDDSENMLWSRVRGDEGSTIFRS